MSAVIEETRSGEVTVRLIERAICSFVIVYDSEKLAAIHSFTTNRVYADRIFKRAVRLAESGLTHPAWKQTSPTPT